MTDDNSTPRAVPLAAKVAAAMAEAGAVTKTERNREQNYRFASAEQILAAVRGPLLARGVSLIPSVDATHEEEIVSRSGARGTRVVVQVRFMFTDGTELIESVWRGEGQDYGDKALAKAFTSAVKTFVRTAWLLPTEHDDPEASPSGERHRPSGPVVEAASPEAKRRAVAALAYLLDPAGDDGMILFAGGAEQIARRVLAGVNSELPGPFPAAAVHVLTRAAQALHDALTQPGSEGPEGQQQQEEDGS